MQALQNLLYAVSNAFLAPALLAILAAFLWMAFMVGRFLSDWTERRKNQESFERLYDGEAAIERFLALAWRAEMGLFAGALERWGPSHPRLEKDVADLENRMRKRVETLGVMARTGPILGLVGTLIPLQPALAGLARGDMQSMAGNLLIGFTTTVIGLLVGGTAYAISVATRNWYRQDLTEISFLLEQWTSAAKRGETSADEESIRARAESTARSIF